jgi:hypothetical protein
MVVKVVVNVVVALVDVVDRPDAGDRERHRHRRGYQHA